MLKKGEIKRRRIKAGLSIQAAADLAKFASRQRWHLIESDPELNPTLQTLFIVATVLDCTVADLIVDRRPTRS